MIRVNPPSRGAQAGAETAHPSEPGELQKELKGGNLACRGGNTQKIQPGGRDVIQEDTGTMFRRFWETMGGDISGSRAAVLAFTRRKADLIFQSNVLA